MTRSAVLSVRNLKKAYNGTPAVKGVDLEIRKGTCFGLLGPNGAGKTTAIEIMEDILEPDEGEILYKGKPRTRQFSHDIGIQFQQTQLMDYISVEETLSTFSAFYRRSLPLDEVRKKMNDRISGGQRQRLLLGLALINDPEQVFLDEPTTGLDPQARINVWHIIKTIKDRGRTVVLTTHYMEEAQSLCDRIAIMDSGRIVEQGTPEVLISRHCRGMAARDRNLESVFLTLTGRHLRE